MYFLTSTMKEIEKSENLKFFMALIKEGWELDFYNYGVKLEKKIFPTLLILATAIVPNLLYTRTGRR